MPIPSKAEFQRSTNLKTAISDKRAADTILNRIDALLDAFHAERTEPGKAILLGKLYYAADAWLKKATRGESGVNARRSPAVNDFYVKVVHELSTVTAVPINLLPNWLTATFGKAMVAHGAEMDIREGSADYLSEVDVRKFRLSFRSGVAYQQRWWTNRTDWVTASSANVVSATRAVAERLGGSTAEVLRAGFSGYVLSQGGDFYSGPHFAASSGLQNANGRFHSSYFAGEPILSAGEIKIENGHVVEINTDSGHYQPGQNHLRTAVETLAVQGVALSTLWVKPFNEAKVLASEYLRRGGLEFAPVAALVPRRGWALNTNGDTPASRARVTKTLAAHRAVLDRQAAFAMFALHCKPKSAGGLHGPAGRAQCQQCKDAGDKLWAEYLTHMARKA